MVVSYNIPVRTVSEANRSRHEHWGTTRKRAEAQRENAKWHTGAAIVGKVRLMRPSRITPWRVSAAKRGRWKLDKDNLAASLKHVQDGVADALGIDDGKLHWDYDQRKSAEWGVDVELVYEGVAKKGDGDDNE